MYFSREEFALASRVGRVPRPTQPRVRPEWERPLRRPPPELPLRSRLTALVSRRREPPDRHPDRIDIHQYLELEFTVEDRR